MLSTRVTLVGESTPSSEVPSSEETSLLELVEPDPEESAESFGFVAQAATNKTINVEIKKGLLTAVVGPNDMVMLPKNSKKTDWEIELGLVIGEPCKYVNKEDALNYVAGYFIANDVSERNFQKNLTGQWTKGKSCDTFGPIGPWLVTSDEVKDPQDLNMSLDLNGERMQTGNTSKMIFSVAEIISHLSQLFTLHPGDVIITGTPPGVGAGIKPEPKFLKSGDIMSLKIDGLGSQEQKVGQDR